MIGIGAIDVASLHRRGVAAASQRRRVLGEASVVGRADIERPSVEYRTAGPPAALRAYAEPHAPAVGTCLHAVAQDCRKERRLFRFDQDFAAFGTDRASV